MCPFYTKIICANINLSIIFFHVFTQTFINFFSCTVFMHEHFDLIDKVKRYGSFSRNEIKGLVITIIAFAFIISFRKWGEGATFDFSYGLASLFLSLIIVAITVFTAQVGHRVLGLRHGYRIEFKPWYPGILIGLIMVFLSRGVIWLLLPGGVILHHMAVHRLGYFRYGTNTLGISMVSFAGPLANIILATIVKTPEIWFGIPLSQIPFFDQLVFFNWAYALFALLPIPPLPGSTILFHSRLTYSFIFGSVAGYFVLIIAGIYSFFYAVLIGAIFWLIYYSLFERRFWKG